MMLALLFALIPGILVYVFYFGWGVVVNITLAVIVAIVCESLMLLMRHRPIKAYLLDGSAVVTAVLFAVALPTLAPWWLTMAGIAFAIVIAKHLYGGLGYNPFNPAMVGYATLLIAFPKEMTAWLPAGIHEVTFVDNLRYTFLSALPEGMTYDSLTNGNTTGYSKNRAGPGPHHGRNSSALFRPVWRCCRPWLGMG